MIADRPRVTARRAAAAGGGHLRRVRRRLWIQSRPRRFRPAMTTPSGSLDGNVLSTSSYSRGDVDGALTRDVGPCRHGRHSRPSASTTPSSNPNATLAVNTLRSPTGARKASSISLRLFTGGQGIWDDRDDIARHARSSTSSQVVVELVSNGGAFGGKEDMSNQAQTATGGVAPRPAGEDHVFARGIVGRPHRSDIPIRIDLRRRPAMPTGTLTALRVRMLGDIPGRTPRWG